MRTSLILAKLGLASFNCVAFCNLAPFQGQDLDASKYMALVVLVKSGASLLAKPCCNKPRSAKSQIWWCSTIGILVYLVQCSRSGCVLVYLVHWCSVVWFWCSARETAAALPSHPSQATDPCTAYHSAHMYDEDKDKDKDKDKEKDKDIIISHR